MNRKSGTRAAVALIALALAGCVREAEIAMPSDLAASAERIALTGMGGWDRGRFRLGASQGEFSRRAAEARYADLYVHNSGGGHFRLDGPEAPVPLSGDCRFDETALDIGAAVVSADRLAYRCGFRRGSEPVVGGLVLDEVPTSPSLLAGRTRAGELRYGDLRLDVRAIHDMKGGAVPSGTPLGYAFSRGGRPIGAIDLNGGDKTLYLPRSGPEREAVLAGSLALAIFWDPGDD